MPSSTVMTEVRYRQVADGDSPTVDAAESGTFDKVIELQATSNGASARHHVKTPRWQQEHRSGWAPLVQPLLQGVTRRLFTPRVRGLVLLNLVMLACASVFVVLKEGQLGMDPFVFSSLRFVIAALAFSPILRGGVLKDPAIIRGGIELGIWAAGGYLTQSVGMVTADASRGAFLTGLTVVIVPVCAGLSGSGVKRSTWGAVVVAMIGVYLLEGSGSPPQWGDLWNLASAISFSLQIFRAEHYTRTYTPRSALAMMGVGIIVVAAISIVIMVVAYPWETTYFLQHPTLFFTALATSKIPWLEILYLGVGVTDGGLYAEVIALQDVGSVEAAFIYTLEPVAGAALAYFWLGERWGTSGWVGAALIVGSCLVTQLYGALEEGGHHHHHHAALPAKEATDDKE